MNSQHPKKHQYGLLAMVLCFACHTAPLLAEIKTPECTQGSTCITISGKGQDPLNKEKARQEKQQWDSTRSLRQKMNQQTEKDFIQSIQIHSD